VKDDKNENHYLRNRYYGSFQRTFQLPADINPDKAEASFDKGVLKISMPKKEKSKTKKISINAK
jgi:HSP20 family protein